MQYSCVGTRFFEGMINTAFFNKIRKKLADVQNFWKQRLASFEEEIRVSSLENASVNPIMLKELLMDKIRFV